MGVTYVSLAAEHPIALELAKDNAELTTALLPSAKSSRWPKPIWHRWKRRAWTPASTAIHPITGREVPVWIANYVLMDYGSGAVMAVPAHDQRDYEFAKAYGLPIEQVISASADDISDISEVAFTDKGVLINSAAPCEDWDGLDFSRRF